MAYFSILPPLLVDVDAYTAVAVKHVVGHNLAAKARYVGSTLGYHPRAKLLISEYLVNGVSEGIVVRGVDIDGVFATCLPHRAALRGDNGNAHGECLDNRGWEALVERRHNVQRRKAIQRWHIIVGNAIEHMDALLKA